MSEQRNGNSGVFKKPFELPKTSTATPEKKEVSRHWRIKNYAPNITAEQDEKLRAYFLELIRFNGRINLISTRTEEAGDIVHILDSILAAQIIFSKTSQKEIYDVGSGNGLPGVVMAILDPNRQIILIDKDARKIEFLKHVSNRVGIKNLKATQTRVEDLADNSVHCCVSRGFASISKSIMTLRKCCASGAEYFHMKSDSWVREVAQIPTQVIAYWEPELVGDYKLPIVESKFSIVLTKKN